MNFKNFFLFLFMISLLIVPSVIAQKNIPVGLQKIIDYNNNSTLDFSTKISFFIAFIAGILVILSPCVLPLFPAYFSFTFKEKSNITGMTLIFFLGFSSVFVTMGVIAGFVGAQTLLVLQPSWLVILAGIFLVYLGVVAFFGKKACAFININNRFKNDIPGTFLFGVFFAIGWTACLGPILAGILGISAILGNVWKAAFLMFFYSLGSLVPLLILSMMYDKIKKKNPSFFTGKYKTLKLFGKKYQISVMNMISGFFFILIGFVLIIFQGTGIVNTWDFLGTKKYFYSIQNAMMSWKYIDITSTIVFLAFIILIGWFFWRQRKLK